MMHYLRKGDRNPSPKLIRKIEELERSSGLLPPAVVPYPVEKPEEPPDVAESLRALRAEVAELRKEITALRKALEDAK